MFEGFTAALTTVTLHVISKVYILKMGFCENLLLSIMFANECTLHYIVVLLQIKCYNRFKF